jgi:hypothetical protein
MSGGAVADFVHVSGDDRSYPFVPFLLVPTPARDCVRCPHDIAQSAAPGVGERSFSQRTAIG